MMPRRTARKTSLKGKRCLGKVDGLLRWLMGMGSTAARKTRHLKPKTLKGMLNNWAAWAQE
eukprot:39677-Eustigmatos_ZCMA.PRE.1